MGDSMFRRNSLPASLASFAVRVFCGLQGVSSVISSGYGRIGASSPSARSVHFLNQCRRVRPFFAGSAALPLHEL